MVSEPIRIDLPANARYFRVAAACVAELLSTIAMGKAETVSHDLQLAVQEVCANIARHAYRDRPGGRLIMELTVKEGLFTAEFRDWGFAFDPASAPEPDLTKGREHGYGLFVVRSLVDELTYRSEAGENCWRLTRRVA
jgi:serine/threonine-protein kinase RsbW